MFQYLNVCLVLLCFVTNFDRIYGQDVSVIINTKRSLHIVDERFISIVVDPMILWTGLNISSQSLNLAKHFSPALIRIHGPSSSRLSFSDHDADPSADISQAALPNFSSGSLKVTPSMWTSLNKWIISANLTPVYALNDRDRVNDAWNPKATALPLMELTDKMNITCYWELANDTPDKTLKQYVDDVTALRHILDAFPASRNSWGTVGEDFNQCAMPASLDVTRKLVENIETHVDAVNWSPKSLGTTHFLGKTTKFPPFTTKYSPAVWTTAPRSPKPTSFKDGLLWAKYLGQAAVAGYDVIFRQPKIKELFEITPAYWVSLFHKSLMGRNVLDVRSSSFSLKDDCFVYAHCSKKQNRFSRRGAATVFSVNMEKDEANISVKLLGTHISNLEIQSYVLTAPSEDSSETYLNGHLLTISDLQDHRNEFMPKVRRTRTSTSVILTLPPKSVGFFVMPNAQLSTCIHGEEELHHIQEEILEDQNENIWKDETVEIESGSDTMTSMNELYMMMEDLLESNEKYYKNPELLKHTKEWKKLLIERAKEAKVKDNTKNIPTEEKTTTIPTDVRNIIIGRARLVENQKKTLEAEKRKLDLRHMLFDRSRHDRLKPKEETVVPTDLELSSVEINKILADRAKYKVEENIENADTELSKKDEEIMQLNKKADELLNEFSAIKKLRGNLVSRRKRDLRNMNPEENLENSANINDIESEKVSDLVPTNMCKCRETGKCTCGLRFASKLINKIWGVPRVLWNGNLNDIPKSGGFKNFLDFHGPEKSVLGEERDFDNKGRNEGIQAIKKLLRQYHNEVNTIGTSTRDVDGIRTKVAERDNKESNQEPTVQVQRKKRTVSETLKEKHRQEKQKLRNRIKSRKAMFENRIKERNGLTKYGQRSRRTRREAGDEDEGNENGIDKIDIGNGIVVQPNIAVDSTTENLKITGSTDSELLNTTNSSTKSPIVGKPQQKQQSSKFKSLNRRLVQQKKLEERIAAYLERIRQTNRQLSREIQRSVRSVRETDKETSNENQENMIDGIPNYITRIHIGADSDLVNPLQKAIRNDAADNLLYDILKREQDSFIDIRKREIDHEYMEQTEINDQNNKNSKENRTTKWNSKDGDQTKEEDIFFNEIPKEEQQINEVNGNGYEKYMDNRKVFSSKYNDFITKKIELRRNKLKEETKREDMDNVARITPNYADDELLFNEIPKEDKFLPAKLRKEEFVYFTGPKILNSDNGDLEPYIFKEDINKSEDGYGTKSELADSTEILNIQIPMNQNADNIAYELVSYPLFDSVSILPETALNGYDFNAKSYTTPISNQIQKYEINSQVSTENDDKHGSTSNENIVIRFIDNTASRPKHKVRKDGFVDNVFETVFSFLNDFHKTVVNYMKYLAR